MLKIFRLFFVVLIILGINSCSQLPFGAEIGDITQDTAKKVLELQLKDLILKNSPILPSTENAFQEVERLPGTEFKPDLKKLPSWSYNSKGEILLSVGDHIIPVWTFCLNANASSPSGYIYTLSTLKGSASRIIQKINSIGLSKYPSSDIQMLVWALQAGFSYEEMNQKQRLIIDDLAPEFKVDLEKSFYRQLEEKWNSISNKSNGIVPSFAEASDSFLNQMGSSGQSIIELRKIRRKFLDAAGNYEVMRSNINTRRLETKVDKTLWSKTSDRVYARFVTKGHFQEPGFLQIRVMPDTRDTAGVVQSNAVTLDVSSLVAESGSAGIQPLSLTPIIGFGGMAIEAGASINPYTAAVIMAGLLAAQAIDWDAFFKLAAEVANSTDQVVKDMVKHGNATLNEIHDRLDKPLKENKIVSGKNLTTPGKDDNARIYEKGGGEEKLNEDFEKIPGEKKIAKDGTETKVLPNGDKVVKRPINQDNKIPTLEVQAGDGAHEKVKVRYQNEISIKHK